VSFPPLLFSISSSRSLPLDPFSQVGQSDEREMLTRFRDDLNNTKALLSDPKIPKIPWEDLEFGEVIGRGAAGVVNAGVYTNP